MMSNAPQHSASATTYSVVSCATDSRSNARSIDVGTSADSALIGEAYDRTGSGAQSIDTQPWLGPESFGAPSRGYRHGPLVSVRRSIMAPADRVAHDRPQAGDRGTG